MKPGDKVVMNNKYYVSAENKSRIWTVASEPWMCCGTLVVKLEGKSGGYAVDGLNIKVNLGKLGRESRQVY